MGYGVGSVRYWVRQGDVDDGDKPGVTTAESERIKTLKQENGQLRRANDILGRAATFCVGARPPVDVIVEVIDARVEYISRVPQVVTSTYYAAKRRQT